ncbi:hypothetical protein VTO42DRAFT_7359 [Malbranchea cinnamomea]
MKYPASWAMLALLSFLTFCYSSPVLRDSYGNIRFGELRNQAPLEGSFSQLWINHNTAPGGDDDGQLDSWPSLPSWETTHLLARRLLALSTTGVLSTVFQDDGSSSSDLAGVPVALPDYIADCSNDKDSPLSSLLGPGNPLILALNIGTTFRNAKAGSNVSLSLDWWHHHTSDNARDELSGSLAGLPRLSLIGTLEPLPVTLPDNIRRSLESCFLAAHPDAVYWLPGHPDAAHSGYWARLVVHRALWIGGFGDRARIGWLNVDTWRNMTKKGKEGKRGWEDVKLPGE